VTERTEVGTGPYTGEKRGERGKTPEHGPYRRKGGPQQGRLLSIILKLRRRNI
jgi:hypothetical protein